MTGFDQLIIKLLVISEKQAGKFNWLRRFDRFPLYYISGYNVSDHFCIMKIFGRIFVLDFIQVTNYKINNTV